MKACATADGSGGLPTRNQLRWQCRRGMLELDLLLGDFLEQGYASLSVQDRWRFVRLLEYSDSLLLEWLMGRIVPADREVIRIVETIRNALAD